MKIARSVSAVILMAVASIAAASQQVEQAGLMRMFAGAFVQGRCSVAALHHTRSDGTVVTDYAASNADLHFCQYVREKVTPTCMANGSCLSYEAWTKENASLSPDQPRDIFLSLLAERVKRVGSQTKDAQCFQK